jgi:hypothetical protein
MLNNHQLNALMDDLETWRQELAAEYDAPFEADDSETDNESLTNQHTELWIS